MELSTDFSHNLTRACIWHYRKPVCACVCLCAFIYLSILLNKHIHFWVNENDVQLCIWPPTLPSSSSSTLTSSSCRDNTVVVTHWLRATSLSIVTQSQQQNSADPSENRNTKLEKAKTEIGSTPLFRTKVKLFHGRISVFHVPIYWFYLLFLYLGKTYLWLSRCRRLQRVNRAECMRSLTGTNVQAVKTVGCRCHNCRHRCHHRRSHCQRNKASVTNGNRSMDGRNRFISLSFFSFTVCGNWFHFIVSLSLSLFYSNEFIHRPIYLMM